MRAGASLDPPPKRQRASLLLLLASCLLGCATTQDKARARLLAAEEREARVERDLSPRDVIPGDLDLVVRVDVARMRAGLGPAAVEELTRRALASGGERELVEALACAEVVWVATRAVELSTGDRVLVVEGKRCMPELARSRWQKVRSDNGRAAIFDRKGQPSRAGTARILNLKNRATVFVSAVELDSVKRVLAAGPDPRRGDPVAEGLLSADLRTRELPPGLARKYPSIAGVLSGVERIKGSMALVDDGLRLDAQVLGKTLAGAEKAARFLEALRDSSLEGKLAETAKSTKIEVVDKTVRIKLTVPAKALLAATAAEEAAGPPTR